MTQWFFSLGLFSRNPQKIELTVETSESWGVQWFRKSESCICPTCNAETMFIPPDLGAQIVRADVGFVGQLIESGRVHCGVKQSNECLICLSSLRRAIGTNE